MGVLFPVILSRADLIRAEAKTCADRSRRDLTPRPATNVSATNVFRSPKIGLR
jgi:hypothetical protein